MTERLQLLHDSTEIKKRIGQMAAEISARYDGQNPLFVTLLNGGAMFGTRLMEEIARQAPDFHPQMTYMMTSRYPDSQTPNDQTRIVMDVPPDTDIEKRDIVVIDDVLDMGETAKTVRDRFVTRGARYVALAVLVDKLALRTADVEADFAGFKGDEGWLVGFGMNDNATAPEAYRWANGIWRIMPEQPDLPPQLATL